MCRRDRYAAHGASWMDTLNPQRRRPLAGVLASPCSWPHALGAICRSGCYLSMQRRRPRRCMGPRSSEKQADFLRKWQRDAAHACDECVLETHLADLSTASRALLLHTGQTPWRPLNIYSLRAMWQCSLCSMFRRG